jgi:hypothetical protein
MSIRFVGLPTRHGSSVFVRALLAFGAGILISACDTQKVSATPHTGTRRDSAEQVLYGARSALASDGVRRGELTGDTVMVFDAATRFEFRGFRVAFSTTLGRPLSLLVAKTGTYRVPGGVLAHGQVAISSDTLRRRIDGAWVSYDPAKNQLSSDSAFVATSGTKRLSGVGFTADPGLFTVKCTTQCVGSLGP